jgi:CBS domain-containing protein
MDVGSLCRNRAITIGTRADLVDAARLMRESHLGFLVVMDEQQPLGVLTDRDIVLEAVAADIDPHAVTVGDAMTRDPVTVRSTDDIDAALLALRTAGVRRAPIVGPDGGVAGVLSVDDVLEHVAGQLATVTESLRHEQAVERLARG